MISGRLALLSTSSARLTASAAGICAGAGSMTFTSDFFAGLGVHHLAEQFRRQIEIDAARAAGHRGADRAREADADVWRVQHAERRLAKWPGDRELVHFLIVALLQVDDFALGRARNQDHREAVGRGVRERGKSVEEARRRHGEANARLLGQEAGDRRRIASILLVPERQHANAGSLRHAAQIGDRNSRHAIDRVEAVELERVDDEVKTVRQLLLRLRRGRFAFTAASAMGLSLHSASCTEPSPVFAQSR